METNMEVLGSPLVLGSSTSKYTLSTYKREHNSPVNTEHNAVVNKQPLNRTMVHDGPKCQFLKGPINLFLVTYFQ